MEPKIKFDQYQNTQTPLLEKQWVRRVREDGDRLAFEKLFKAYYKQLVGFAYTYVRCGEHAEDIVQTIFLRIWSNKETWAPPGNVKTYLFAAIRNAALNDIRHEQIKKASERKVLELYKELKTSSDPDPDAKKLRETIQKEIDRLPSHCRKIFLLNRRNGLTYSEIADYLNISINTVNTQMGRALKVLRKNLSDYAPLCLLSTFWL